MVRMADENEEEAFCNLCGLSCAMLLHEDIYENAGLINAVVSGGYSSTPGNGDGALDDMVSYGFSLCEFCLDFLFSNMKIPPTAECGSSSEIFKPALARIKERMKKSDYMRVMGDDRANKQKAKFLSNKRKHDRLRNIKAK